MKNLFTPWRLDYITGKREEGCVFCKKPGEAGRERDNLILHLGKHAFVIMNRFPYNSGHLMVVPFRHTDRFEELSADESAEMAALLKRSAAILRRTFRPEGFNIGLNLGRAAGAGILEHLHWHIVPRWVGDTNFLPVFSETRAIPQHLVESWDVLKPHFDGAGGESDRRTAPPAST